MKALKINEVEYFDELPESIQDLVRECIIDAAQDRGGPDGWKSDAECIDEVECRSRSGFSPFSHNKGGLMYRNFADLMSYWGGGYNVSHKKANEEIQRQIEYSFECLRDYLYKKYESILKPLKITEEQCTYHDLNELADKHPELEGAASDLEDSECEFLSGDENSIMHEIRFMYHGSENGIHRASISAAVNTEGPYHRSHISWAPNVFCEGAKEVEITWRTEGGLKTKLIKALKLVTSEVF